MDNVIASWLFDLLQEKQYTEPWKSICTALTQEDEAPYSNELEVLRDQICVPDPGIMGAVDRPYYKSVARTITYSLEHRQLPPNLIQNPMNLLVVTNAPVLEMIQKQLITLEHSKEALEKFLFDVLTPADWRIFLHIRTTQGGSAFTVMPPSLRECLEAFTRVHQKANAKPRLHGQPYQLTVGAKALSKHWHRDRQTQFWGICTGTEAMKNEHANQILIKILNDPVWVNLHSLPHERTVYEIRQSQGYGVRWVADKNGTWEFRGFLEPQMEDGHSSKWIH